MDIRHRKLGKRPWFCTYCEFAGHTCEKWHKKPLRQQECIKYGCRCFDNSLERKEYIRTRNPRARYDQP